jgi:hypothetical protein
MSTRLSSAVLTVASLCVGPVALAATPVDGEVVAVDATFVFAPVGFDDNDDATIVVDGYLPSGCYRQLRPIVEIDHEARTIKVIPQARYFDVPCIAALVPYWNEIRLGVLAKGSYKVTLNQGDLQETLSVAEATNAGPDDYLYAAIDAATVSRQDDSTEQFVKIEGRFTNSCMVLDEVRLVDTGKTINVLPIMRMEGDDCGPIEVEFRRMVKVPDTVTPGRHLLHVRSLNGKAVNYLFTK